MWGREVGVSMSVCACECRCIEGQINLISFELELHDIVPNELKMNEGTREQTQRE